MDWAITAFMAAMGLAIGGIWTWDIARGRGVDISSGVFRSREPESDALFWPHWLAEYGTAASLIAAAIGRWFDTAWSPSLSLLALGALIYTSTNALGWAFADRSRYSYSAPMVAGAVGGLVAAVFLVTG